MVVMTVVRVTMRATVLLMANLKNRGFPFSRCPTSSIQCIVVKSEFGLGLSFTFHFCIIYLADL